MFENVRASGLRVITRGRGTSAVVLLHGLGNSAEFWLPVMSHMRGTRRVMAVDLPGFGESRNEIASSPEDVATQVAAAVTELGVTRVAVVAHSLSSAVALALASSRRDLVERVVLVDGTLFSASDILRHARTGFAHPRQTVALAAQWLSLLAPVRLFVPLLAISPRCRRLLLWPFAADGARIRGVDLRAALAHVGGPGAWRALRTARHTDLRVLAAGSRPTPVAIVWGTRDRLLREDADLQDARRLLCIDAEAPFAGVGHWPMLEAPQELAAVLNAYVD